MLSFANRKRGWITDMARCYIELRKSAARGTESIAADIMRHLYSRQHLGRAVVVSDNPVAILSASRKQWLKLARSIQKQRSSTLNADKILKFTHIITRMQHMRFSAKSPIDNPDADIYFLDPSQVSVMPIHCWTVYVLNDLPEPAARAMLRLMPAEALIVDYQQSPIWDGLGLPPKHDLEQQVKQEWKRAKNFLEEHNIDITSLLRGDIQNVEAIDEALDTLLNISYKFLQIANDFQHSLELARPLKLNRETRRQHDMLVLLAHRVQALSPGAFTQQFLEVYNEDDTIFLYDLLIEAAKRKRKFGAVALGFAQGFLRPVKQELSSASAAAYSGSATMQKLISKNNEVFGKRPNTGHYWSLQPVSG